MTPSKPLDGRVALVTGANNPRGIGAAIARALAGAGADVLVHGCPSTGPRAEQPPEAPGDKLLQWLSGAPTEDIAQELRALGVGSVAVDGDLSDPALIGGLFERAAQELGPVDILINNAAYWEADTFVPADGKLAAQHVEMWTDRPQTFNAGVFDRIFAVNTRAVALAMSEFARRHAQRTAAWGRIVNISTAGAYVFPSEITYGASKLALEGYTRSAATELGPRGITVNTISPGPIQTGWVTPELERHILPTIPMGRIGQPEDIAAVVEFLVSEQARWVTGQRIFVGGGHGM